MAGPKKKESGSIFRRPLVIVTLVALIVLFIFTTFRVTEIEVKGASNYTRQEIIQASRIEEGDPLFFLNRLKSASYIFSKLPYIDEVSITTRFPGSVTIQVKETTILAYVEQEGKIWGLDADGVLAGTLEEGAEELIRVSGIKLENPEEEASLEMVCGNAEAAAVLCDILKAVDERGLASEISAVEMKDPAMPKLIYRNFTVILDGTEAFNRQLALVQNAVSQIGKKEKGTIDLTIDNRVHYTPVK